MLHLRRQSAVAPRLAAALSVTLLVMVGGPSYASAAEARKGDLVYALFTRNEKTYLVARSPGGVKRFLVPLSSAGNVFKKIAISADGKLAFLTTDREYSSLKTDMWVVRIAGGTPKVLSKLSFSPLYKGVLSSCGLAGPAAIAVGNPNKDGNYPVFVGLTCTLGCKRKLDAENSPIFSSTYVLNLRYSPRTGTASRVGQTRTSFTDVCTKEIVYQVRALALLPGASTPLMVIGDRDAQTFHLRSVKSGSRNVLTWRSKYSGECINFAIGGPKEFYSLCPGRFTGYYAAGTIRRIRSSSPEVTKVGPAPKSVGRGFYNSAIATLPAGGRGSPFYAVTAQDNRDVHVIAHGKAKLGSTGRLAFSLGNDKYTYEMAIVP